MYIPTKAMGYPDWEITDICNEYIYSSTAQQEMLWNWQVRVLPGTPKFWNSVTTSNWAKSISALSCVKGSGVVHELAVNLQQADRYLLQVPRFQRQCLHCRPN